MSNNKFCDFKLSFNKIQYIKKMISKKIPKSNELKSISYLILYKLIYFSLYSSSVFISQMLVFDFFPDIIFSTEVIAVSIE